jgi:hypothetical protein
MVLEAAADEPAQVAARRVAGSPAGSIQAQSRSTPAKKVSAQPASLAAIRSARGELRRGAEQQLADTQAGALREQLHRRVRHG